MSLRPRHFVCMMLLLSALRAADGAILPADRYGFDSHSFAILLSQGATPSWAKADHTPSWSAPGFLPAEWRGSDFTYSLDLSSGHRAAYRTAWAMRPPAAQSTALHAATSFAI